MKHQIAVLIMSILFIPSLLAAQSPRSIDSARLEAMLKEKTSQGMESYLSAPDAHGDPLVIKLARQGDVKTLQTLASYSQTGNFLSATDKYGNNLFHVAKNVDTVQVVSSLFRHYYGAKAPLKIKQMANTRNKLDETPLHAQINAAHSDTFRLIYGYTSLKKKNDDARNQLTRLHGADERIYAQHKDIYCRNVISAASANGMTILQSAQAQIPYNPQMAQVAGAIERILPCLTQN